MSPPQAPYWQHVGKGTLWAAGIAREERTVKSPTEGRPREVKFKIEEQSTKRGR